MGLNFGVRDLLPKKGGSELRGSMFGGSDLSGFGSGIRARRLRLYEPLSKILVSPFITPKPITLPCIAPYINPL